ncbi:restriction endonuclease subunit S [Nesterenkonia sp. NBAIMH1]|uniref:restriction endonuclease subunit S n=1 Tax=Nesterenkonia sp. NBAIMH1 TaxID=2600320 RepID=UPI0011B5F4DD|nr:restriction endonuclease subunit S [Nesterenkonia sp. NBAIMH1]
MSELPTGWTSAKLKNLVISADPGFAYGKHEEEGVFQFRMNNIRRDGSLDLGKVRRVPTSAHKKFEKFLLEDGDVLFNATNGPGLVGKTLPIRNLPEPAVFSNHFVRLRPYKDAILGIFLAKWLQWQFNRGFFNPMTQQWVNQASLKRERLLDIDVPVPPLLEQRRIAAILDKTAEITEAATQYRSSLHTLWETTFNSHYSTLTDVAQVPLDDCSVIGSGITKGRKTSPSRELYETPYLTVANVQDGHLALAVVKTIAATKAEQDKYRLEHGDVLLTEGGDPDKLGRGTIWRCEVPGAINQNHIFRVRPNRNVVDPAYLAMALRAPESRAYFLRHAKQTTGIATINKTQLGRTPVRIPALEVQRDIVRRCEAVTNEEAANDSRAYTVQALTASLQSRAFRGDL